MPVVACGVVAAEVVAAEVVAAGVVAVVVRVSPVAGAVARGVVTVVPTVEEGEVEAGASVPLVSAGGAVVVSCVVVSRKCSRQ